jgi:hypothetical protein
MMAGEMRRLLPALLLLALPLAGCGGSDKHASTLAVAPLPPKHHVPVVAKDKLVAKAERLCRQSKKQTAAWAHPPVADASDPINTLRRATAYARRIVVASRRGYHRFHALGVPRRGLARRRWMGFLSQYQASIDHLDELQAGADSLEGYYTHEALRLLIKSSHSAVRRGRKLGLDACVS